MFAKKISIKNIIKGVAITFIFGAIILYFIMSVPITITFIQETPEEVVQDISKKLNGELTRRINFQNSDENYLITYIPRWKRIVYKNYLKNNSYIKDITNIEILGFAEVEFF